MQSPSFPPDILPPKGGRKILWSNNFPCPLSGVNEVPACGKGLRVRGPKKKHIIFDFCNYLNLKNLVVKIISIISILQQSYFSRSDFPEKGFPPNTELVEVRSLSLSKCPARWKDVRNRGQFFKKSLFRIVFHSSLYYI
jgi:hypothetical protein